MLVSMNGSVDGLQIFTIGHSNHPLAVFLDLLKGRQIEVLADIRRFPGSRKHPHFGRENLAAALNQSGIEYRWLESLGGRRRRETTDGASLNTGLRDPSFRNYADFMATEQFRQGISTLLQIAAQRRTAIMCAEGLYWRCHRRLVSDYLQAIGVEVQHIFPGGQVKPHRLTPGARIEADTVTYPGPPNLFDP